MSPSESKKTEGKKTNNLIYVLNSPKGFIKMFTEKENCTYAERPIQKILKRICALRNSGGGKLTILFTETCSKSEAEKIVEIIKNAVDEALSDTTQLDLLVYILSRRIIFLASGSNKVVTMHYNLYFITDGSLEFVSCTKSAEDVRLFLRKQNSSSAEQVRGIRRSFHYKKSKRFKEIPEYTILCYVFDLELMSVEVIDPVILSKVTSTVNALSLESSTSRTNFTKQVSKQVPIKGMVKFKSKNDKLSETHQNNAVYSITLKKTKLLSYVSAFANHSGGDLFYGVCLVGTVVGEKFLETESKKIREKVREQIASLVWPQHAYESDKFWEIHFNLVKDKNYSKLKIYLIKINIKPCPGGVFIDKPESYYVVENTVENFSFSKWIAHIQNSTTEISDGTAFIELKEHDRAFDRIFLPDNYQVFLESLGWVESFRVADENEECGTRHLEIACNLGEVPRTADIVEHFGEEILPFLTFQKGSKREWFETNIFDENCDMKQKYEDKLLSLPWVEGFYVGVTSKPEKSWQIYITCAPNVIPSMADLKREFGADIAHFVDFVQESVDESSNSEDSKEPLLSSSYLRGPISGDELLVQEDNGGYGAIGILTGDTEKHYATTCYHVCFKGDFPKNDIKKGHEILTADYANQSQGCMGSTCVYTTEEGGNQLGQFCHGLYDDNHDIALIELQTPVSCRDTVEFFAKQGIRPVLANKKEVKDMFYDMEELPVEIIRPEPTKRVKGKLFAATGVTRCPRNKRCYRIRRIGKKDFATEGDSGSLVYLLYEGEKIPFAYVCMVIPESDKVIYYCRSMGHSLEELIKRHMPESSMKPCLEKCGKNPAD